MSWAYCDAIAEAACMNNAAVSWINDGLVEAGHLLLLTAVQEMTSIGTLKHSPPCTGACKVQEQQLKHPKELCLPRPAIDKVALAALEKYFHTNVASVHFENKRSFRIFSHPLLVDSLTAISLQSENLVRATMLYNLALLLHVKATESSSRDLLEQVDSLYRSSSVAVARALEFDFCTERDVAPLLLAIWNNRAYIRCWEIIDHVAAQHLIHAMNEFLHVSVKAFQPVGSRMTPDHYYFFYMNAMLNAKGGLFQLASAA